MSEMQRRGESAPARPDRDANPLRMLPAEWRKPVGFFFSAYSDVLKGPVGIVALLRMWIRDDGLTLDEGASILKRLLKPEEVGKIQYAGQLIARLGQMVEAELKARRGRERAAEDRTRADRDRHHAAPPEDIRRQLARHIGIGGGR